MASRVAGKRHSEPVINLLRNPVLDVAPRLLGYRLVRRTPQGEMQVRIVETEAYREDDPASHSFGGRTERSGPMFASAGHWYVYLCYGVHWLINVSSGPEGTGEAVLIRAGEPLKGEDLMEANRGRSGVQLTNGPGKLAEALQVDGNVSGTPVAGGSFRLVPPREEPPEPIYESPRVGIQRATERYWRFFLDNPYRSEATQNGRRRRRN